ncbi:MAG: LPS export ABC transporter permease LptG [Desulfuromonas sp.]|nr:MAG: LPS export ABC transporter permease LptG [Desulfuromonas sp.]
MKILRVYLLRHFLRILSLCCGAFIGIYLLIDFFEKVDDFIEHKAVATDYLSYLFNSIPFIFSQILPLAILTTVVLTIGGLGRTNEITAMRACGVSLWKIFKPMMVMALGLSFFLLLLNEFVVPWNGKNLNQLLEIKLKGKQQMQLTSQEIWYRDANRIINITLATQQERTLSGITIFTFNDEQKIVKRENIATAHYSEKNWQGEGITTRTFTDPGGDLLATTRSDSAVLELDRVPEDFFGREDINNELSFWKLAELADKLEQEGYESTRQRVDMHNRLAAPFTCLIMGFLGVPFALQRGRNSNIAVGIGLSLTIGVIYFIIQSLVMALGYAGALPAFLSAWTANFIFLLLGIWLLLNVKE